MYNMLERKQHDVGVMLDGHASRLGAQKVGPKAMAFGDNRSFLGSENGRLGSRNGGSNWFNSQKHKG